MSRWVKSPLSCGHPAHAFEGDRCGDCGAILPKIAAMFRARRGEGLALFDENYDDAYAAEQEREILARREVTS